MQKNIHPLGVAYFQQNAIRLGKDLIGKILVRKIDDTQIDCRIVETEAYMGVVDKASHAFGGKRTRRNDNLYLHGGIAYVYSIYGKYCCFNIVVNSKEVPESVFIRAVEPFNHIDVLKNNRSIKITMVKNLTNGPAKLCQALKIDKSLNGFPLAGNDALFLKNDNYNCNEIIQTTRINADYAEEDKDRLWRFYLAGNPFVSLK